MGLPGWRTNGIDRGALRRAEAAARRSGRSLGGWIDDVVSDLAAEADRGSEPQSARRPPGRRPPRDGRREDLSRLFDALSDLADRVSLAEERASAALEAAGEAPNRRSSRIDRDAAERSLRDAQADLFAAEEEARRTFRHVADHARGVAVDDLRTSRLDAITEAVTALGRRMDDMARRLEERPSEEPDLLSQIRARLDAIAEARSDVEATRVEDTLKGLDGRLAEIAERVDRAWERPPPADPARDERLARIEQQLTVVNSALARPVAERRPATFDDQLEWARDAATGGADLGEAIRQIAERQKVLERKVEPEAYARAMDGRFRSLSETMERIEAASSEPRSVAALQQQIRQLSDQLQASRAAPADPSHLAEIQRQLGALHRMIEDAVSRTSLAAVIGEVRDLADRVETLRRSGEATPDLSRFETELRELRKAVERAAPRENFAAIETQLATLSRQLGERAVGLDKAALSRIEKDIADFREVVAAAMPADTLRAVLAEVRRLGEVVERRSDRVELRGSPDALEAVEHRLAALTDKLDRLDDPSRIAADIRAQIEDVGRTMRAAPDAAMGAIESKIGALAEKLDRMRPAGGVDPEMVAGLERQLAELTRSLDARHRDTLSALETVGGRSEAPASDALRALQDTLAAMRASSDATERRTIEMLATLQQALAKVGEKLAASEDAPPPARPAAAGSLPRATLPPEVAPPRRLDAGADAPPPARDPRSAVAAAREAAARAAQLKADPGERLSADQPLEPGSGRPASAAADAVRAARAQIRRAEAETTQRAAEDGETVRSSFIAAARRAASAAAGSLSRKTRDAAPEAPASPEPATDAPVAEAKPAAAAPSLLARFSTPLEPRQKKLVMLFAAVMILLGAWQALAPRQDEPPPPAAATTGEAAPAARPDRVAAAPSSAPAPETPAAMPAIPDAVASPRLRAALAAGDPRAMFEVGARFTDGRGVARDPAAAAAWYRAAAERDHPPSLYRLANMLERGQGVTRDLPEAVRLYQRAANAGNRKAMHNLAALYASGAEGRPDYERAVPLFQQAAELGLGDSQYNLAVLHVNGLGTRVNLSEAYTWFAIAAQNGDREAARKRDEIGARLDGQALVTARLAAQSFRPKAIDPAANEETTPAAWEDAPAAARGAPAPPAQPNLGIEVGPVTPSRRG
jgi:localization factor PodJL